MTKKQIQALEGYFKTDNEHWNGYAFEMLCTVLKQGNFENPEIPLQLFSKAVEILIDESDTPLKALQGFGDEVEKKELNPEQKHFVYEKVYDYIRWTDFDDVDTDEVKELLKSQTERLKDEVNNPVQNYDKPLVGDIRSTLKELMQQELEQLPETLKELEPVQRLNVLCKLIPYVLPKVEAVHSEKGEPEKEVKTSISGFHW